MHIPATLYRKRYADYVQSQVANAKSASKKPITVRELRSDGSAVAPAMAEPSLSLTGQDTTVQDNTHTKARASITDPKPSKRFEEWWAKYPRKVGKESALHSWCFCVNADNEAQVFACLERYLDSEESTRAPAGAAKWLNQQSADQWAGLWPARNGSTHQEPNKAKNEWTET